MRYSAFLLFSGALASVLFTLPAIRYAYVVGAVDVPDGGRHRHAHPTARLGGLAVFFSSLLSALFFLPVESGVAAWLSGGGLLCALGVSDDISPLSPKAKLIAMSVISLLPAFFGMHPEALALGSLSFALPRPISILFSAFFVLLLTNAFNLIDGADGLAAVLAMIGAVSVFLAFGNLAALLLLGAVLGFLPYNLPRRIRRSKARTRSFLGDTGALFLGYSLAVFSLENPIFSLFVPFFFALPLFDLLRDRGIDLGRFFFKIFIKERLRGHEFIFGITLHKLENSGE